jgi:hypothetical protein
MRIVSMTITPLNRGLDYWLFLTFQDAGRASSRGTCNGQCCHLRVPRLRLDKMFTPIGGAAQQA